MTSVGPVIGLIQDNLQLTHSQLGILTTLPLITFSTTSLFVSRLTGRIGLENSIMVGIILIGLGTWARGFGSVFLLFFATGIMGAGISVCNVALIPLIKNRLAYHAAITTSAYTLSMSVFSALGSGLTAPIALKWGWGWNGALMFWVIPVLLTIPLWYFQLNGRNSSRDNDSDGRKINIWKSRRAWQVTIFMGIQSFIFYSLISWGPEILHTKGMSVEASGWAIFYVQLISLPAVFLVPVLAEKEGWLRYIALGMIICFVIAFLLLLSNHVIVLFLALTFAGCSNGGSISLSYYLINRCTLHQVNTVSLSGMAQSFGYYIAAAGPFLVGWGYGFLRNWNIILAGFLGVVVVYGVYIFASIRKGHVETDLR